MPYVLRGKTVGKVKKEISYQARPIWPVCSNCKNFTLDRVTFRRDQVAYTEDRGMRCSRFHIVVGKTATCRYHELGTPRVVIVDDESG